MCKWLALIMLALLPVACNAIPVAGRYTLTSDATRTFLLDTKTGQVWRYQYLTYPPEGSENEFFVPVPTKAIPIHALPPARPMHPVLAPVTHGRGD